MSASATPSTRRRILIGKPGLDGHNRGVHVLVRALRDAGFEVIYTGIRKTPEQIVEAAVQEDVAAVGVSSLSGAHMTLFPEIAERLAKEAPETLLFCGGIIPDDDREALARCGYKGIFGPGTSTEDIIQWLRGALET
ncbi:MAG TPA: cobalamin B12-binding domain-containing protein [Planctomycetota bacterium]|nr:cobalamin B12-binding domain-containing protein [Planctomycetota bacterium]